VVDFLRHDGHGTSGLKPARQWVLIWGLAGTLAAFLASLGNISILSKALFFTSLFIGPLLALFLLAFFRPKLNPTAVFIAAFGGMAVLLLFLKIPILPDGMWTPLYPVAWPWNPLIAMTATVVIAEGMDLVMGRRRRGKRQYSSTAVLKST
jgi:SSS family solute:Na+ symporter